MNNADTDDWNVDDSDEDPDTDYGEDSDDEPTVRCPYCRFEMLEICTQCPSCGQFPSAEDSVRSSQPRWVIVTAILCLASIAFWLLLQL